MSDTSTMIRVNGPDGKVINFPASMSHSDIDSAMGEIYGSPSQSPAPSPSPGAPLSGPSMMGQGQADPMAEDRALARRLFDTPLSRAVPNPDGSRGLNVDAMSDRDVMDTLGKRASAASTLQGLTFGFSDELAGIGAGLIPGGRTGEEARQLSRDLIAYNRDQHPIGSVAGELTGAAMTGGAGLQRMGAVRGGAVAGGAYGFGSAEGNALERAPSAGVGAVTGAATGFAGERLLRFATPRLQSLGRAMRARGGQDAKPQALDGLAQAAYRELDNSGAMVTPDGMKGLAASIRAKLDDPQIGFDPQMHRAASNMAREIQGLADQGQSIPIGTYRSMLKRLARVSDAGKKGGEDAFAAGEVRRIMMQALDDPRSLAGGRLGDGEARALLQEANDLWRRSKLVDGIDAGIETAKRGARKTGARGGLENRLRGEADKLIKKQGRFMDDETKTALEKVIMGNPVRNTARTFYQYADPTIGGLGGALNIVSGTGSALASGGATLPINAAGFLARKVNERSTQRALEAVRNQLDPRLAGLRPPRLPAPVSGGVPGGEAGAALSPQFAAPAPVYADAGQSQMAAAMPTGGPAMEIIPPSRGNGQGFNMGGASDAQIMQMLDVLQREMAMRQSLATIRTAAR